MTSQKVVPVGELKRQVDAWKRQYVGSIYVQFSRGVKVTWNKCPCDPIEICINDTHCYGNIYIEQNGYPNVSVTLKLISIRKNQATYIEIDPQFHKLMEHGNFAECRTELVHY